MTCCSQRKCDQYWPNEAEHTYGQFIVRLASVHVTAQYTVRVFGLRHSREKGTNILRVGNLLTMIKSVGSRLLFSMSVFCLPFSCISAPCGLLSQEIIVHRMTCYLATRSINLSKWLKHYLLDMLSNSGPKMFSLQ